jgi:hypothetical protein
VSTDATSRTGGSSKITKNKNLDKILKDSESGESSEIGETISVGSMKNRQSKKK